APPPRLCASRAATSGSGPPRTHFLRLFISSLPSPGLTTRRNLGLEIVRGCNGGLLLDVGRLWHLLSRRVRAPERIRVATHVGVLVVEIPDQTRHVGGVQAVPAARFAGEVRPAPVGQPGRVEVIRGALNRSLNLSSHLSSSFLEPNHPPQPLTRDSQRLQRRVIPLGTPPPRPTQPPSRRTTERQACPARGVPGGSRGRA